MEPRYQCLGLDGAWSWRLLGSNHRELARACSAFATQAEAAADALAVGQVAATAPMEISVGADTSWRWVLTVDGEPRAASAVHYARRLECLRAVARFRDCAPVATMGGHPLVHRAPSHSRPGVGPDRLAVREFGTGTGIGMGPGTGRGEGQFRGDLTLRTRSGSRPGTVRSSLARPDTPQQHPDRGGPPRAG